MKQRKSSQEDNFDHKAKARARVELREKREKQAYKYNVDEDDTENPGVLPHFIKNKGNLK